MVKTGLGRKRWIYVNWGGVQVEASQYQREQLQEEILELAKYRFTRQYIFVVFGGGVKLHKESYGNENEHSSFKACLRK